MAGRGRGGGRSVLRIRAVRVVLLVLGRQRDVDRRQEAEDEDLHDADERIYLLQIDGLPGESYSVAKARRRGSAIDVGFFGGNFAAHRHA